MDRVYISEPGQGMAFLGFNVERSRTPFTILGAPLDLSTSFRGGSAGAPKRIREVSKSLELCSLLTGIDMESIGFEDLGDVVLSPGDMQQSLKRIEEVVGQLLDEGRVLLLIGGEHTITLPSFKSLAQRAKAPCLLVFDAHADLRDEYLGSKYNHATVIRRIVDETMGKVIIVGVRAVSKDELRAYTLLRDRATIVRILHGRAPNMDSIVVDIKEKLRPCSEVHLSIDMDVLDPAYAPGVQTPEPLGMDPITLLSILEKLIDSRVRVVDVVEVAPHFDVSDATSFLAARIIVEVAALIYRSIVREGSVNEYMCRW